MIMNPKICSSITLQDWLIRANQIKTATKELVRLWMVNDLGCQKELANHLGVDTGAPSHVTSKRWSRKVSCNPAAPTKVNATT